jgi:hypothetical protein
VKRKDLPRSPLPNEKSAGLPFCSFIKADGKQCRARAIGRAGLEKNGLLEHEHAGEWCLAHLVGPHELGRRGGLQKAARWRVRKDAEQLVAETSAVAEGILPVLRAQPGEIIAQLDADQDVIGAVAESPARIHKRDIRSVEWKPYFDHLTPEQRLQVLRTRGRS